MEISFSFRWVDVLLLMPVVVLAVSSMVPLLIKVMSGGREPNSFATMCYGLAGVIAAAGWLISMEGTRRVAFDGALVFDGLSTLIGLAIVFAAGVALVFSRENFATNTDQFSEHVFLMLNAAAGMLLVSWANDLIFFFIGIELMSLCLYVLIAISGESRLSKEAAFKYFLLGSFASAILLYGVAFVFGTAGSTNLQVIAEQSQDLISSNRLFLLGLIFLVVGIAFKVSIFPLHAWTPDVYQGAPTPVTGFMATGAKAATFVLFLRLVMTSAFAADQANRLIEIIQWMAALTILAGNIAAVMQTSVKRMLAYSSVAHSGYIMIGLIVASIGGEQLGGSSSVIFYLVAYTLMTIGAFGVLSLLEKDEDSQIHVEDLRGLAKRSPWMALCLTVLLLSLAGIPPMVGFFGKFFIFSAAVKAGLYWLAVWGVIGSVVSVYYYLRPIMQMYMRDEVGAEVCGDRYLSIGAVSVAAIAVVVVGLFSSPLYQAVLNALRGPT